VLGIHYLLLHKISDWIINSNNYYGNSNLKLLVGTCFFYQVMCSVIYWLWVVELM